MHKEINSSTQNKFRNVAFIPVRGGSKSIPLKNIKDICGRPLVNWVVLAAIKCEYIDKVFVSTDSELIFDVVKHINHKKVIPIWRSDETSSDTASTESAMLEFAENYDFENICLIQATSPLLTYKDLNRGFEIFAQKDTDSVLSCVRQKRFSWTINDNGFANSLNYDHFNRPRRQDFDGELIENGAFYITSKNALISSNNRISGNIKICEMDEKSYYEIDEPSDWGIVENLLHSNRDSNSPTNDIKLFLTDCDGCLTDGSMYYTENGDEIKRFNAKDGMGFFLLRQQEIKTGIITGERVALNKRRAKKLKVDFFVDNCKDKLTAVREICSQLDITLDNVCYVGDDINDLDVIKNVGFSTCPSDANPKILNAVDYVSKCAGGRGAVRDIIDKIIKS